ncbi:PREDICTED: 3-oxoacyl-[acyl-carrier-protein] synthase II, chloroplastic-like [Ipomoea nil]|uniref:3-oxoacyl-[acyl-carrier-protein] synthase II, chloroplastic-like n=1 Tax=Ipomoea nil TaxID=35883 RepID=UPI00090146EB|nr:PREDICTED: 3-oxoacyl-[acyl-carrier-protein] synthase II, chloroplastic-like [Ipomoea nil]XP_019198740.1 PREDICTED: 3-oxoacyl-[acyl-carrier-protein] synthase II, chloroplastic-like [Ipomoea nil]
MGSSAILSWSMAACTPVACEKDSGKVFLECSSVLSNPKCKCSSSSAHDSRSGNRKRIVTSVLLKATQSSIGSGLYARSSNSLSSSNSKFVDNGFSSLFGSGNDALPVRRCKSNSSAHKGGILATALQPAMDVVTKEKPSTRERRVVVTGLGVASPLGHEPNEFYENLLEGVSGISEIEAFDCAQYSTRIAGEIKSFSTDGWVVPKLSKRLDRFMLFMLMAGKKALVDGGITDDVMDELDKKRCGVLIGSALGGMRIFSDAIEALRVSYKKMNPFCVPFATTNMGSAILSMDLGWMGPNYSISTACATSNFCILNAANHIIRGEADMMLSGGSDSVIIPTGVGGFIACRALSQRNNDPTRASRPWDSDRDGFVMGEGAGVVLLEELEHAKKRGATIYAEFLGGSFTSDAHHMTEPHPEGTGVVLCIEKAIANSGICRDDVNYINAHATSTQAGDLTEFQALLRCFGQNPELRINSTKSMIGHLLGAAGAVEAVATVQAIRTGWVHPNINLENPDEGVDTKVLVGSKKEQLDIKVALSNSFGFGGHNSSILFAPYK